MWCARLRRRFRYAAIRKDHNPFQTAPFPCRGRPWIDAPAARAAFWPPLRAMLGLGAQARGGYRKSLKDLTLSVSKGAKARLAQGSPSMSQLSPPETKSADEAGEHDDAAVFVGRIDILYRPGRNHLFLPFASLCLTAVLYTHAVPFALAVLPFLLQIAASVGTGRLAESYKRRRNGGNVLLWAHRYVLASAVSGAAWGAGAVIWFVPHQFPADAFLALTFLGMTAAEFITRSVY